MKSKNHQSFSESNHVCNQLSEPIYFQNQTFAMTSYRGNHSRESCPHYFKGLDQRPAAFGWVLCRPQPAWVLLWANMVFHWFWNSDSGMCSHSLSYWFMYLSEALTLILTLTLFAALQLHNQACTGTCLHILTVVTWKCKSQQSKATCWTSTFFLWTPHFPSLHLCRHGWHTSIIPAAPRSHSSWIVRLWLIWSSWVDGASWVDDASSMQPVPWTWTSWQYGLPSKCASEFWSAATLWWTASWNEDNCNWVSFWKPTHLCFLWTSNSKQQVLFSYSF